nr:cytochrome P450 3A18-like isoform X3 [Parasteatoda tepidariorum]
MIVAEPEAIRDIFVKDFQIFPNRRLFDMGDDVLNKMMTALQGEDWKRVRAIVSPTFSTGKLKRVLSIFQDCAKTLIQSFSKSAELNAPIDVLKFYGAFTMDIIASSAFSTKIDANNDPDNVFIQRAKPIFNQDFGIHMLLFFMFPKLMKKLGSSVFPRDSMQFFKKITLEIVKQRKQTGQKRNDFLQLLMDSADEVSKEEDVEKTSDDITHNYGDESENRSFFKNISTKTLSMDELVAQCGLFFIAGYHTTAVSLAFTTYHLALDQNTQDKVFSEIEEVLSATDGEISYESIQKMKYLDNVISESLRLHPPFIRLDRTAEADFTLTDTGIIIPKGTLVSVPIYAIHRDPKLFPDPESFNPDRFSSEERDKIVPYSYLPFGAGPRNCVGMRFALLEMKICLAYVISIFHVETCPETKVPLEYNQGQGFLRPKDITLHLKRRENCPLKQL